MLRAVELSIRPEDAGPLKSLIDAQEIIAVWQSETSDGLLAVRILVRTNRAERLLDSLEDRFAHREGFRAIVLPVQATVPAVKDEEEAPDSDREESKEPVPERVARAEIQAQLATGIEVGPVFLTTIMLSAVIAAIGLIRDNVAVIIGAMVVAPLLTPNVALAFAVTIGDIEFGKKAARATAIGFLVALAFAVLVGLGVGVHSPIELAPGDQISTRTQPSPSDLLLALASGAAGALAFTSGVSAGLVGVMVAVALLPPTIVSGLMASQGEWRLAFGALLLLAINAICVILAGVGVFVWRGVGPRTWWEREKAKQYTMRMTIACVVLSLILLSLVYLAF